MNPITCLLIILFVKTVKCKDCVIDNRSRDFSWEVKLYKDVTNRCKYIYKDPPANSSEKVAVSINYQLKFFKFSSNEEIFTTYNWLQIQWRDERLKWKPEDYSGIDRVFLFSQRIWSPGIFYLANTLDEYQPDYIYTKCTVRYNGKVLCRPKWIHESTCDTDLTNWPYDIQKCSLTFYQKAKVSSQVKFTFKGMVMLGAEYGAGWTIIDYVVNSDWNNTENLQYTLVLERVAEGLAAVIVNPTVILCILTLCSPLLRPDNIRLLITSLSLLLHNTVINEISADIPKHGATTPLILLFVRNSIVLTVLAVFWTFLLIYVQNLLRPVYGWVSTINSYVFNSKFKYLINPMWERRYDTLSLSENLEENRKNSDDWKDFSNVLNSLLVAILMLGYTVLFLVYMPKITVVNNN